MPRTGDYLASAVADGAAEASAVALAVAVAEASAVAVADGAAVVSGVGVSVVAVFSQPRARQSVIPKRMVRVFIACLLCPG